MLTNQGINDPTEETDAEGENQNFVLDFHGSGEKLKNANLLSCY